MYVTAFQASHIRLFHGRLEQVALLGPFDDLDVSADEVHIILFQGAALRDCDRRVQGGLAPQGRKQRLGALEGDDFLHHFGHDRFDIGPVRDLGVRHDRRGIAVDQDDSVALLAERLARLSPGVIEFAGLPDDDGPASDQHDGLYVGSFWHAAAIPIRLCSAVCC